MAPTSSVPNRSLMYTGMAANPPPYIEMMTQKPMMNSVLLPLSPNEGMAK